MLRHGSEEQHKKFTGPDTELSSNALRKVEIHHTLGLILTDLRATLRRLEAHSVLGLILIDESHPRRVEIQPVLGLILTDLRATLRRVEVHSVRSDIHRFESHLQEGGDPPCFRTDTH